MDELSDYLTTAQVAEVLGVTRRWVVAMITKGILEAETIRTSGKRPIYLIARSVLDRATFRRPGNPGKNGNGKKKGKRHGKKLPPAV